MRSAAWKLQYPRAPKKYGVCLTKLTFMSCLMRRLTPFSFKHHDYITSFHNFPGCATGFNPCIVQHLLCSSLKQSISYRKSLGLQVSKFFTSPVALHILLQFSEIPNPAVYQEYWRIIIFKIVPCLESGINCTKSESRLFRNQRLRFGHFAGVLRYTSLRKVYEI